MSLASLGFQPFFSAQIEHSTAHPARVLSPRGELTLVHDGSREWLAPFRGTLRQHPLFPPAVGDWVTLEVGHEAAVITSILDRRTAIARKRAGREVSAQVLAANVDRVLLVMALDKDFNVHRLERYLTLVWDSGATPVVVLTKMDLTSDLVAQMNEVERRALGFPVFAVDNLSGEGLQSLTRELRSGETIVLLGSSGVGKSTLINRIAGKEIRRTAAIRSSDGRGRHTTTDRQLLRLPSGVLVIDTPGLREVQLWAEEDALDRTFTEVAEIAGECRFSDCSHTTEPGCAVREAVSEGNLDSDRVESYQRLRSEIEYLNRQTDPAAARSHKSKMKKLMRAQKAFQLLHDKRR